MTNLFSWTRTNETETDPLLLKRMFIFAQDVERVIRPRDFDLADRVGKLFQIVSGRLIEPLTHFDRLQGYLQHYYSPISKLVSAVLETHSEELIKGLYAILKLIDNKKIVIRRGHAKNQHLQFNLLLDRLGQISYTVRFGVLHRENVDWILSDVTTIIEESTGLAMSERFIRNILKNEKTLCKAMQASDKKILGVAFGTLLTVNNHHQSYDLFHVWFAGVRAGAMGLGVVDSLFGWRDKILKRYPSAKGLSAFVPVENKALSEYLSKLGFWRWGEGNDSFLRCESNLYYLYNDEDYSAGPDFDQVQKARDLMIRQNSSLMMEWVDWINPL